MCVCARVYVRAGTRANVRACVRASHACRRVGTECVHAATTTGLPSNSVCSPLMLLAGEAFPPRILENKAGCRSISPQDIVGFRSSILGCQRSLRGLFSGWVQISLVVHKIKVDASNGDCWCHFCGLLVPLLWTVALLMPQTGLDSLHRRR
jgi:hypothetical protein